jgi:hypothetical protein
MSRSSDGGKAPRNTPVNIGNNVLEYITAHDSTPCVTGWRRPALSEAESHLRPIYSLQVYFKVPKLSGLSELETIAVKLHEQITVERERHRGDYRRDRWTSMA